MTVISLLTDSSAGTKRILHVDNEPDLAELTAAFLEREHDEFDVTTASSASEGLDRLAETDFDCIVSDFDMPGQNGIEFFENVRSEHPDLPFILFTGKGSEEVASEAISAGVTDYLQKGNGIGQYTVLANRVSNAIDQYCSRQMVEQSGRRLREIIDAIPCGLYVVDEDGTYLLANEALAEFYGTTVDAIEGATVETLLEESVADQFHADLRETLDADTPKQLSEVEVTDADGELHVFEPRLFPCEAVNTDRRAILGVAADVTERQQRESGPARGVFGAVMDDDGEVESQLMSDRDITERKGRECDREGTNAVLSTLFETLPVGVLAEDASRNVLAVNERLFELFEASGTPEEVIGTDCGQLSERISDAVVDSEGFVERSNELVMEREPAESEELALNDGRTFERSYRPIELPDGTGHLWVYRDMTTTNRKEKERRKAISTLEELYEITTDPTSGFEEKITRVLETGREYIGLPYGFLTRIDADDVAAETGVQTIIEAVGDHELLQPGEACPLSEAYCRKTIQRDSLLAIHDATAASWKTDPAYETFDLGSYIGAKVHVNDSLYGTLCFASTTPSTDEFTATDEMLVRLIGKWVGYELERQQSTAELERQNERLAEFASIVSHDLRNPLNVAQGRLELVSEECDSEHLDAVACAHERMNALIDDVLVLAREGETVHDTEPVDLATLAEGCWETVPIAEATLTTDIDEEIRADRNRLKQLVENLFRNAVEHGGEDVTVTVGQVDDGFYVEDDGPGIPDDERDGVFGAGYSTAEDGTGLGLSIVKRVADAHGWEIRVTDGSDGGARFEITGVE